MKSNSFLDIIINNCDKSYLLNNKIKDIDIVIGVIFMFVKNALILLLCLKIKLCSFARI